MAKHKTLMQIELCNVYYSPKLELIEVTKKCGDIVYQVEKAAFSERFINKEEALKCFKKKAIKIIEKEEEYA